ncbi:unnamed protein product [Leptidea sinapis]|uniref:Deltamethrin resistance protein prag01 domain-containing protein n=1 Tax=Leptidea sinapis TaxID=189913 RepID=A0A5E4PVV2_9NEOP|nr:unnamed protein product [Leptidea sinapis]
MLRKLLAARRPLASFLAGRKYLNKTDFCYPHMNELPVPCGPWNEYYNERQRYYNLHLFAGITWFFFSFCAGPVHRQHLLEVGAHQLNLVLPATRWTSVKEFSISRGH